MLGDKQLNSLSRCCMCYQRQKGRSLYLSVRISLDILPIGACNFRSYAIAIAVFFLQARFCFVKKIFSFGAKGFW